MEYTNQEKKLLAFIQHSFDAIVLINPVGKVLQASPATEHILGYKPDEFVGMNGFKLVHPQDLPKVMKSLRDMIRKKGEVKRVEVQVKRKDGTWIWVETYATNLLFDPSIKAIVVNFRDITERKLAEGRQSFLERVSATLNSTIDYRTTLQGLAHLIVPYLADYCRIVILDETKQIQEITIHQRDPKKKVLIKKLYALYKDQQNDYGVLRLIASGKSEIMSEVTPAIMKNMKTSPELISLVTKIGLTSYMGVPMKIGKRIIGVITFSSTQKNLLYTKNDLKFAEEVARQAAFAVENAQLYQDSQSALNLRNDFISAASHELRTPITSLKIYTQLIQKKCSKQNLNEFNKPLSIMNEQIDKLTKLVEDLLNVSKIKRGQLPFSLQKIDLNKLIQEVIDTIQVTNENVTITLEGTTKRKVFADKYRIYQVITNLLINAIKYSPHSNKVSVRIRSGKNNATVYIEDFGIGIDIDQQKRIFEQYYRAAPAKGRTYSGLGMGLFIASEIIKRHGSKIGIKSNLGKGSTFSFSLPYKKS